MSKPKQIDDIFGPSLVPRYADLTQRMKTLFCEHIALCGIPSVAIKALNLRRGDVFEARKRDPEFKAAWDEAQALGIDAQEDEAARRAFEGYLEPVYYLGNVVGHVRKYSDGLAQFLLKGAKPEKFRERYEVEGSMTLENKLKDMSDAELQHMIMSKLRVVGVSVRTPETYEHEQARSEKQQQKALAVQIEDREPEPF